MRINDMLRVGTVAAACIAGAASATAPKAHKVTATRGVNYSFESTWTALIDVFADRNWAIDNLDKESGIVTTDWMSLGDEAERYADCGSSGLSTVEATQIKFNVRVKGDASASTVSVNTKFRQQRRFDSNVAVVDCSSTGAVESEVQRQVDSMAAQNEARSPRNTPPVNERNTEPVAERRGFFCASSPGNAAAGFCVRDKAECGRIRDVSVAAVADLTACTLVETAWCFGDRCAPTEEACREQSDRAGGLACVEVE